MYKLYELEDDCNRKRYLILLDGVDPTDFLDNEYNEQVVTDCWLSDVIKCEPEDILIPFVTV